MEDSRIVPAEKKQRMPLLKTPGARINYAKSGSGPAVLLIQGGGKFSMDSFIAAIRLSVE